MYGILFPNLGLKPQALMCPDLYFLLINCQFVDFFSQEISQKISHKLCFILILPTITVFQVLVVIFELSQVSYESPCLHPPSKPLLLDESS